ncbi:MAG: integrase core domain-containing protein, partial [Candidatus Pacearchaeota archaeon]
SISIFKDGIRRYIISAVDIKTRFSFSYGYKSLTSLNAKDFMEKLQKVFPFPVKRVQTDNRSEFESYLRKYLEDQNIIHYFNFPKHPQQNCYVERFNRTLQEQFIFWNEELLENIPQFNSKLMNYLLWFNTQKPHYSLNKFSPLDFFLLSSPSPFYPSSQKTKQYQSNMYRYSTKT